MFFYHTLSFYEIILLWIDHTSRQKFQKTSLFNNDFDGSQPKIILIITAQLQQCKLKDAHQFCGKLVWILKSLATQNDLSDYSQIWQDHLNRSKLSFQIIW